MQAIAMPIQKLLCSTRVLLLTTNTICANGIFRRIPDGVIVYPDSQFSGHTAAVRLTESSLHWPDQRVFILTRSAFAGSQRYADAVWSGELPFGGNGKHTVVVTYTGGEKTLSLR
jgi:hypothetical protein